MKASHGSDLVLLNHIRECIKRIREYTGERRETFERSRMVQDAVVRNLQTLAESTQRLGTTLKTTEPNLPREEIAGFRNVLTHAYLQIDPKMVWSVIEYDLPELSTAIERMTRRASNEEPWMASRIDDRFGRQTPSEQAAPFD